MARRQHIPAKKRAARSALNTDMYNRQQEIIRARCLEINPDYKNLPWLDRQDILSRVRKEMGLPYLDINAGEIRPGRKV